MTIKATSSITGTSIQDYLPLFNLTLEKDKITTSKEQIEPIKLKKTIQNPKKLLDLSHKPGEINKDVGENFDNSIMKLGFIYPITTSSVTVIIIIILAIAVAIKLM